MPASSLRPDQVYFLRADVRLQRPAELVGASGAFDYSATDWVLSCPSIRARSKIISERIHRLLFCFRGGARVTSAIVEVARERGEDARELLRAYLPVLQDLAQWGYLALENQSGLASAGASGLPGALPGYTTRQVLKQSAALVVLRAESADGETVCIKRLTESADPIERAKILNEAAILERLNGLHVPCVRAFFPDGEECGLVTSWAGAISSREAFGGALGAGVVVDSQLSLGLAIDVLGVFVEFHRRGVLHSDIHYHNVRFDDRGGCCVIDFGLSFVEDSSAAAEPLLEAATPFLAPEQFPLAQGDAYRRPTGQSEQYSLGALLYYLLSGRHYLDFRLEAAEMIEQVRRSPPNPLVLRNGETVPTIEHVLTRALAKRPSERHASLEEFAGALVEAAAAHRATRPVRGIRRLGSPPCPSFQLLQPERAIQSSGNAFGIAGSLNYALAALALASALEEPEYLEGALIWAGHARSLLATRQRLATEVARSRARPVPYFIGVTSLHEVPLIVDLALIAIRCATGEKFAAGEGLLARLEAEVKQDLRWDFTTGHASLLNALCHFARCRLLPSPVVALGGRLCEGLLRRLRALPESAALSLPELGLAHGHGGAWSAVLQWLWSTQQTAPDDVRELFGNYCARVPIHQLRDAGEGRAAASISWWCNGLSGILGVVAGEWAPLETRQKSELVSGMAEILIAHPPQVNHLCCGKAGQALALLQAHRVTGREAFRQAAQAALEKTHLPDRGHTVDASILKGELGVALVAEVDVQSRSLYLPFFGDL